MLQTAQQRRPRVALLGVGAVGGTVAAVLEHAGGCELTLIARGATLAALQKDGLTVHMHDEALPAFTCRPRCVSIDDTSGAGEQDFVLCCTKAHQLPPLVDKLLPLFGEHTVLVPVMNGVPFWHNFGLRGVVDAPIQAVDPGGQLHAKLGAARAIGCVVRVGGSVLSPGVVKSAGPPALVRRCPSL
jgi:2-dehydropantoate 2-reductase